MTAVLAGKETRSAAPPRLWPHQDAGVRAACQELGAGGRASLVAACGTGKTVVGAETSRRLAPAGPVLVVVPTLELLAQTAQQYASWLGAETGPLIAVCGDNDAIDAVREVREQMAGLHASVTTDPALLAGLAGAGGRATVLTTYASLPAVAAAHRSHGLGPWELAVVDEAHRSAGHGAKAWAVIHWDAQIPAARRLYLTATPRIMTGAGGEEIVSMDDQAIFGRIVHEVTFAEAIAKGLLADYRVAVGVVTDAEVAKLTAGTAVASVDGRALPARMAACQVALARAIRTWDLRRVITYHGRVLRAVRFAATLPATLALMGPGQHPDRPVTADYLTGTMALAARRDRLALLADPGEGTVVLSNARVLAEGVDVPELDAIMIADPKHSATDVVQAVGRALRRGGGATKTATIIVPVLVHDGQDEHAVEGPGFETVWRVVRALRAHDERIAAWLDEHRGRLRTGGRSGQDAEPPPWLHVDGIPVTDTFTASISVRAVEVASTPWIGWLAALREYRTVHGHASPPRDYTTPSGLALGLWLHNQRAAYRAGRLDPERAAALEDLGVEWSVHGSAWWRGYEHAAAYRAAHGHLSMPDRYRSSDGFGLASWLGEQRKARRAGRLDPQRAAALEHLGIVWDVLDAAWQRAYDHAAAYHTAHGHLSVPNSYRTSSGLNLADWLTEQRAAYRAGKLAPDRAAALERLGIGWDRRAVTFAAGLAHLHAFRQTHGHVDVPAGYHASDGYALYYWLAKQRRAHRTGHLTASQTGALEAAGVQWQSSPSSWQENVTALAAYVAEHGHARVPRPYVTPDGIRLGAWVHSQRQRRRHPGRNQTRPLTTDQITALDQLGMIWNPARTPPPKDRSPEERSL